MYKPKKKKYNDLGSFVKELRDNGVEVIVWNGVEIVTKDARYTLFDGSLITKSH
jgi:hypothetical protein